MERFNKIKFITFGKGNFIEPANILIEEVKRLGVLDSKVIFDSDLPKEFKDEYAYLLKHIRGYGYWIWKPYVIYEELCKLKDDEILVYMDSTDFPSIRFFESVLQIMKSQDYIFANRGYGPNSAWTKRDTFVLMKCDEPKYWNCGQLEAGLICMKNTEFNRKLILEWFDYCKNTLIVTDEPNTCGLPNFPMYDHRHDQSILTNLQIKYNMITTPIPNDLVMFNYNQPEKYS